MDKLFGVTTYSLLLGILCLIFAAPQYCGFTDVETQRPICIIAAIVGMAMALSILRMELETETRAAEPQKTPSTPTPEAIKEEPAEPDEYTWFEYMADIEKGMSVDEMREKLAGRPVPRRPVADPPPTPDDEDLGPHIIEGEEGLKWASRVDKQRFRGDRVSDPDAFSKTCYLCGEGLSSDQDDYCRSCRAIRLRAPKMAAEMRRRRYRDLERWKVAREQESREGIHNINPRLLGALIPPAMEALFPAVGKCKCGMPSMHNSRYCSVACFQQSLKPEDPQVEKTEKRDHSMEANRHISPVFNVHTIGFYLEHDRKFTLHDIDLIFPASLSDADLKTAALGMKACFSVNHLMYLPHTSILYKFKEVAGRCARYSFRNPVDIKGPADLRLELTVEAFPEESYNLDVHLGGTLETPRT